MGGSFIFCREQGALPLSSRLGSQLSRVAGLVWGVCSALLIVVIWTQPPFNEVLGRVEWVIYDLRLRARPPTEVHPGSRVVVIGIDASDEKRFGAFPWPRQRYAKLIRKLVQAGAGTIIVDMYFPFETDVKGDAEFASALKEAGRVLLPLFSPQVKRVEDVGHDGVYRGRLVRNLPSFEASARGLGHINIIVDRDGNVRRIPAWIASREGGKVLLPVSLKAVAHHLGLAEEEISSGAGAIFAGTLRIPLDQHACIPVSYIDFERDIELRLPQAPEWVRERAEKKPIILCSYADVLEEGKRGTLEELVRGRVVLIGATIQGSERDVHSTPFGRQFGVLIQAVMVHSLLAGEFIFIPRQSTMLACLVLVCIPLGVLAFRVRVKGGYYVVVGGSVAMLSVALGVLGWVSVEAYTKWGIMFQVVPFALMLLLHTGAGLASNLSRSAREAEHRKEEVNLLIRVGEAASENGEGSRLGVAGGGILTVSAFRSLESAAHRVLEPLSTTLPCEGYLLYAVDTEGDALSLVAFRGFNGGISLDTATSVADSINERFGKDRSPVCAGDARGSAVVENPPKELRSLLSVPIESRGRLIGAIHLFNKLPTELMPEKRFTQEHLSLLLATCRQISVAMENEQLYREMHEIFVDYIRSMAAAIDARDRYTHGHSRRVARYSVAIAQQLGLPPGDVELLELAATIHDVGKIGVPEHILNKPGKLTDEEFGQIKSHVIKGAKILWQMAKLRALLPSVRHHHERYDGKGYPDGLAGDEIPLMARVICVADAFDAMTSDRIYRPGMPVEEAARRLKEGAGTHFDPQVVSALLSWLENQPTAKLLVGQEIEDFSTSPHTF